MCWMPVRALEPSLKTAMAKTGRDARDCGLAAATAMQARSVAHAPATSATM
jgi:hypothetical protein